MGRSQSKVPLWVWRALSRDGRPCTLNVTLSCPPLGLTSAACICSTVALHAGHPGMRVKMLFLPSSASSPIGEAISVQQIKSCRTGHDQVPSTDSKMKWDGSGVGRQGGIERDGPLETMKGSWVERRACGLGEVGGRSGLENGHLVHIIIMWGWSPELQADASPQERRAWQSSPVFLPGTSHEQRYLAGYSP